MFRNITEVKKANKAMGHHWFSVKDARRVTPLIGGFYWVESLPNFDDTGRDYMAVAASPDGAIQYLADAERFATLQEAKAIIDNIVNNREVGK